MMLKLMADGLVIVGICILIGALTIVRQLIVQLPPGSMQRRWYTLTALIAFFVVGYLSYVIVFWNREATWLYFIVPAVFFLGACFVLLTARLSLQTVTDIRRVTLLELENIMDPLMGIYNRRYLDRRLEEEYARARRYSLPLSLLLIDVDHFKRINDVYGHQVGDLVLSYLGKLLLQALRQSDIPARYGGEEILAIAPNTTTSQAGVLAERLRQHFEIHELKLTDGPHEAHGIHFTVSIGVAGLSHETSDIKKLVHNADEALYRAKHEGRNRVVIHCAEVPKVKATVE